MKKMRYIGISVFSLALGVLYAKKADLLAYLKKHGYKKKSVTHLKEILSSGCYISEKRPPATHPFIWIAREDNDKLEECLNIAFHEFYHFWADVRKQDYYKFEKSEEVGAFVMASFLEQLYLALKGLI